MKFPTFEEMAKEVAEKALDEYVYEGKTIRQWVEILKDYDDKKTTLERIAEQLKGQTFLNSYELVNIGWNKAIIKAIEIVKRGGVE